MSNKIELVFFVHFPPIGVGFAQGAASKDLPLFLAGGQAMYSVLVKRFAKGSEGNAMKFAFETAERINYFNWRTGEFLDAKLQIGDQDLSAGDIVIISLSRNEEELKKMIKSRPATPLEIAAMEIRNGKKI